jgi:hypothetical protein
LHVERVLSTILVPGVSGYSAAAVVAFVLLRLALW